MILENLKTQKIIDEVIMDGLKDGKLIDSTDFKSHLTSKLKEMELSRPFFNFSLQNDSYTLDIYNKAKEDLEKDLSAFFETIVLCSQKLQYNIAKYNSIKANKMNYINELERKLKELIFKSSPNNLFAQYKESLLNLDNIDDQSTAIIDCEKHESFLKREGCFKLELTNPKVTVSPGFKCSKTNNGTNTIYTITSTKQGKLILALEYLLDEKTYVSSLNIVADYIKEANIKIFIDDIEVFSEESIKSKTIEINGNINKIRLEFEKKEADKYHGNIDSDLQISGIYEYYFVVSSVVCLINSYCNNGTFISKQISLPSGTSYIRIDPEDFIPENSSIDYFYKLNNQGWNEYTKESIVYINKENKYKKEIQFKEKKFNNSNFSLRQLYYLTENIDKKINSNTIKKIQLHIGYNQWKREIYTYNSNIDSKLGNKIDDLKNKEYRRYVNDYKQYISHKQYEDDQHIIKTDFKNNNMEKYILKVKDATEGLLAVLKDENSCKLEKEDYIFIKDNIGDIALNEKIYDNNDLDNRSILYKYTTYIENEKTIDINLENCYWDDKSYVTMEIDGQLFYDVYSLSPGIHKVAIYIKPSKIKEEIVDGENKRIVYNSVGATTCFFDIADKTNVKFVSANRDALPPHDIEEIRFKKNLGRKDVFYCFDNQNIYITSNINANYLLDIDYVKEQVDTVSFKAEMHSRNNKYTPKLYGYELIVG